jgi:hypothetical protein
MADDLSLLLSGALHAFTTKEQRHGSVGAKITPLEMLRLGVEALHHVNQQISTTDNHPAAYACEPLLSAPLGEAMQRIEGMAVAGTDVEFQQFCETFADYGASLSDPQRRKRAGLMLYALGSARSRAQAATPSIASPFTQTPPDGQRYAPQYPPGYPPQPPQRVALEAPAEPHRAEGLFRRYMQLGPRSGAQEIGRYFEGLDRERAVVFFKEFRDYATSLRSTEQLKTALAISNALYGIYQRQFANEHLALPPPNRRN